MPIVMILGKTILVCSILHLSYRILWAKKGWTLHLVYMECRMEGRPIKHSAFHTMRVAFGDRTGLDGGVHGGFFVEGAGLGGHGVEMGFGLLGGDGFV